MTISMKILERFGIASNLMFCWIFFFFFFSKARDLFRLEEKQTKKKDRWSLFGVDVGHEMGGNESFRGQRTVDGSQRVVNAKPENGVAAVEDPWEI